MQKTLLYLLVWLCCHTVLRAQFFINPGAEVAFADSALITLRNSNFENNGALTTGTSTLYCTGKSNQTIGSGGATLYNLQFEKPSGQTVALVDDMRVVHEIAWAVPGAKLVLGKYNLYMAPDAFLTDYDSDSYVVTDNTGYMVKENLGGGGFQFPLGAGDGAYNPIIVAEAGTPDHIGARCLAEALFEGYSGAPIEQNAVAAAWEVVESVPGKSMLSLLLQWNGADELLDFDRNNCGVAQYDPTSGWVLNAANLASANGNDPFRRSHGAFDPGLFMVADEGFAQFSSLPGMVMRNAIPDGSDTYPTTFGLYPNPSSEALFLEIGQLPAATESITVKVFDSKGRQVMKQHLEINARNVFRLDPSISGLPAGFYVMQVEIPHGMPLRKSFIRL